MRCLQVTILHRGRQRVDRMPSHEQRQLRPRRAAGLHPFGVLQQEHHPGRPYPVAVTRHFNGQVLLVHCDSHNFRIDKAMVDADDRITPNFTRVELFGSADHSWIEMTVDPSSGSVFSSQPAILQ